MTKLVGWSEEKKAIAASEWRDKIDAHVRRVHERAAARPPFRVMLPALAFGVADDRSMASEMDRVRALLCDLDSALPPDVVRPRWEVALRGVEGESEGIVIFSDRPFPDNAEARAAAEETLPAQA